MWVVRDIFEELELYSDKPTRHIGYDEKYWSGNLLDMLDSSLFPELTWEDEPLEVELISKKN